MEETMDQERQFLLDQLMTHSLKRAPDGQKFKLASGAESDIYVDVKKTALKGNVHAPLASLLHQELTSGAYSALEAVAGVALGGCHLASIVGLYARVRGGSGMLNVVHVRKQAKDHGTTRLVEGPGPRLNERVVLLEDVVTTGGSSLEACASLQAVGYDVLGIVAVVDRRLDGQRAHMLGNYKFSSLFTLNEAGVLEPTPE
jgi:orotate phosphoribosyltransferase